VFGLPVCGSDNALGRFIMTTPDAKTSVESPRSAILRGEIVLDVGIRDDNELPVLAVSSGRCFERQLDTSQNDVVVDRVGTEASDRALRQHRVLERHVQPTYDVFESGASAG
jgi:hypothetical protein